MPNAQQVKITIPAKCDICSHTWTATVPAWWTKDEGYVWPTLQCPECFNMSGYHRAELEPDYSPDDLMFPLDESQTPPE